MLFSRISRRHLLCWGALFLAGCSSQTAPPTPANFPRDGAGRAVNLPTPASRVIALGPGAVETVWALGAGKKLVGRDDYADFPPETKKVEVAGNFQGPNIEKCIALRPDLVIVQGEGIELSRADEWQAKIGAPVAVIGATTVGGVREEIEKIAAWLDASPEKLKNATAHFHENAHFWNVSVFIEIGRSPLYTAGQNTLVGDVVSRNGFQNIASVRGYQAYNIENLLAKPPRAYLVPTKKTKAQTLAELRAHPTLSKLEAVKKGRVVVVDPDLILRPGPRLRDGMSKLYRESRILAGK